MSAWTGLRIPAALASILILILPMASAQPAFHFYIFGDRNCGPCHQLADTLANQGDRLGALKAYEAAIAGLVAVAGQPFDQGRLASAVVAVHYDLEEYEADLQALTELGFYEGRQ